MPCACSATSRPIRRPSTPRRRGPLSRRPWPWPKQLGMRPLVAHCHLGLGKLYRRTGKREQAQEHLTTATTMYREMDMRFWLEQAEAEAEGARADAVPALPDREPRGPALLLEVRSRSGGRSVHHAASPTSQGTSSVEDVARVSALRSLPDRVPVLAARDLHPQAPRREDPDLQGRPGRRAQAGHGALRRPQGLDGAARRPRSRGGAQAPRSRCSSA